MKLRHPLSGAIYSSRDDDLVLVEHDGRSGLYHLDGRWHSGDKLDVDLHLLGWVGGPSPDTRGPLQGGRRTRVGPRREPAPPTLARRANGADSRGRSIGMDLGLTGRKAVVTAASRGIGFAIA